MLGFLYFGRLEKEKGIDAIIEMIELYAKKNQKISCEIFIFGSGSREKTIQELANKYPDHIHFFGRQSLTTIKKYTNKCSYALIPSECIETFGLSAVNALQRGLQPIGYAKGGLAEFIESPYDLTHQPGSTAGQKLYHLVNTLPEKPGKILDIRKYSKEYRKNNFQKLTGKDDKKILIVSDFINKIGGIETYINDVKTIIERDGYTVHLCGAKLPSGIRGTIVKYLGFILGIANIRASIKVYHQIRTQKPDIIRYHSTMRYLGWMPIRISKYSHAKKRIMIHDLGYFAPFPSKIYQENQIKTPRTLHNFLTTQPTKNICKTIAIIGKYLAVFLIKRQIKHRIDKVIVPSPFMEKIVEKSYTIDKSIITTLPHFIQD